MSDRKRIRKEHKCSYSFAGTPYCRPYVDETGNPAQCDQVEVCPFQDGPRVLWINKIEREGKQTILMAGIQTSYSCGRGNPRRSKVRKGDSDG